MNSPLSKLADGLTGSEIVKLGNEINARIREGENIYNLTIGDFNPEIFPIPGFLLNEIISAYKHGYTNYPPGDGLKELKEGVIHFIKRFYNLNYELDEVQIASGGRPLIYTVFKSIVDEGDKVIYPVPSWNNNHYTFLNNANHCAVITQEKNSFMPTADDIAPHIKNAALLCLCSPQNPTGTCFSEIDLKEICKLVIDENNRRSPSHKKLMVMYDQMYGALTYNDVVHQHPVEMFEEMKNYTIFIGGISKTFAATGVRVGWSMGPKNVIGKMKAFLSHIGAWSPMAEQKATAVFLKNDQAVDEYLSSFKNELYQRLHHFYDAIMKLKSKGLPVDVIRPQGAIYLTIKINLKGKKFNGKTIFSQQDVTAFLLENANLALVPFSAFGADNDAGWFRLSVGTCKKEEISTIVNKLESALQSLS